MSALWELLGIFLTAVVVGALVVLALAEFLGSRIPGFQTISDAARVDLRVAVLVEVAFIVAALWWPLHVWAKV